MAIPRAAVGFVLVLLAGCGAGAPRGPVASAPPADDARLRAPGTSGLPGLDWGATPEAISTVYPGAAESAGELRYTGTLEGAVGTVIFTMRDGGLDQVSIGWEAVYPSMLACADPLHELRARLDERLGASAEENLGVFWDTATASVVLSCNPGEDGRATLSQTYSVRRAE